MVNFLLNNPATVGVVLLVMSTLIGLMFRGAYKGLNLLGELASKTPTPLDDMAVSAARKGFKKQTLLNAARIAREKKDPSLATNLENLSKRL